MGNEMPHRVQDIDYVQLFQGALGLASFLLGALVAALIIAVFLHSLYDLVVRPYLQRIFVHDFAHTRLKRLSLAPTVFPIGNEMLMGDRSRAVFYDVWATVEMHWPLSTFALPPAQLAGQLSALVDTKLAHAVPAWLRGEVGSSPDWSSTTQTQWPGAPSTTYDGDRTFSEKTAETLAAQVRSDADRATDELQVSLLRRWKVIDAVFAALAMVTLMPIMIVQWEAVLHRDHLYPSYAAAATAILITLLVPQIRPWIERLATHR